MEAAGLSHLRLIVAQESGFYYLQSRYYDPSIGRFINADTLLDLNSAEAINLFSYCQNNPIQYWDPSGHVITEAIALSIAALVVLLLFLVAGSVALADSQQSSFDDSAEQLRKKVQELNQRRPGNYTVYTLVIPNTDIIQYAGMTNNLERRLYEHARSEKTGTLVLGNYVDNLPYAEARILEQSLIAGYTLKEVGKNSVNSIGPNNRNKPVYNQALQDLIYNEWSNERYMILEMFPGG